ncbi:MAG: phosphate ABC transporter permease PstA, partial [Bacilli bacterium]
MKPLTNSNSNLKARLNKDRFFKHLFKGVIILLMTILVWLIISLLIDGLPYLSWHFITSSISRHPQQAGVFQGLVGSLMLIVLVALFSMIIGIATALYLEEYANKKGILYRIIDLSISNLSGVPSIIYGILGLSLFSYFTFFKASLFAGALTLSLLVLPVIIVSSQEALKAVPSSLKEGAYGLAMSKWQVIVCVNLPYALPGILTGSILALSRAIGEGAPLIVVGAATIMSG